MLRTVYILLSIIALLAFPTHLEAKTTKKGKYYENILNFGSCGRHLFWVVEGNTLKIRGFGPMDNYASPGEVPYSPFVKDISVVELTDSITSIGAYAFASMDKLTSISIPRYVNRIGQRAFYGCTNLTQINLTPFVDAIGEYAFYHCKGITSLPIPKKVKKIAAGTFMGCSQLPDAIVPEGVTSIASLAFADCINVTDVRIPSSVTFISGSTFTNCPKLTNISVASGNEYYTSPGGVLYTKDMKQQIGRAHV